MGGLSRWMSHVLVIPITRPSVDPLDQNRLPYSPIFPFHSFAKCEKREIASVSSSREKVTREFTRLDSSPWVEETAFAEELNEIVHRVCRMGCCPVSYSPSARESLQNRQVVSRTLSKEVAAASPLQGSGKRQKYFITMKASPESLLQDPRHCLAAILSRVFIRSLSLPRSPPSFRTPLSRGCSHRVRAFLWRDTMSTG